MKRLLYACLCATALLPVAHARADDISFYSLFPSLDLKTWTISDGWTNGSHQSCEWRKDAISVSGNDLQFTLSNKGGQIRKYGCGEMHTNALSSYGLYETRMRSAAGSGLNTAFFTYVGPPTGTPQWDEIDFEFLGKDPHTVQLNYYTNGKPLDGTIIQLGFDAAREFHNYSFDWEPNKITWYVDGKAVHETPAGANLPSHPGRIYLSLWSGSDSEDTWLGHFDYKLPTIAYYSWVKYTPSVVH